MDNASFDRFKEKCLHRFRLYYKKADNKKQRDEIKRSVYENKNLTETQKDNFWDEIIKKVNK